jgi:hypothetical protein
MTPLKSGDYVIIQGKKSEELARVLRLTPEGRIIGKRLRPKTLTWTYSEVLNPENVIRIADPVQDAALLHLARKTYRY